MAVKTDAELKQYFETGDIPTQQQFYDLIDSKINVGNPLPAVAIGGAITGATIGSVLFVGAGGTLQQNNANFYWDNVNKRLGFGTVSPQSRLHSYGDTNADATPLQFRYERPAGIFNSNTNWISHAAVQSGVIVGSIGLAQQVVGQGTRWTFSVTNSTAVTATEGMRLSQTKQLSIGNTILDGAVCDVFSKGLLSTDLAIRVRNNNNLQNDFVVNGAGNTIVGAATIIYPQAKLQIDSITQGVLFPRLSNAQITAILTPPAGLVVYNTTSNKLQVFNGLIWDNCN